VSAAPALCLAVAVGVLIGATLAKSGRPAPFVSVKTVDWQMWPPAAHGRETPNP
jgi:hypothetical protein